MNATDYVILELLAASPSSWKERGQVSAASAEQAIRKHAEASKLTEAATFIAVPSRSWNPRTISVETQTRIRFSEEANG